MASTSSASAKHGERTRNMQRHMALASVWCANYNYKLYKISVELAKRSQKLLCSPAVDLRHYDGAALAGHPHARRRGQLGGNGLDFCAPPPVWPVTISRKRARTRQNISAPSLAVCVARRRSFACWASKYPSAERARGNTDDQDKLGRREPSHPQRLSTVSTVSVVRHDISACCGQ